MHDTIPHSASPFNDLRAEVACKALAGLPEACDNEEP